MSKTMTKFKVGTKVEWIGKEHRQGVITRILRCAPNGKLIFATIQPEEVGNLLSDLKVVK